MVFNRLFESETYANCTTKSKKRQQTAQQDDYTYMACRRIAYCFAQETATYIG